MVNQVPPLGTVIEVRYSDGSGGDVEWIPAQVTWRYAACQHGLDMFDSLAREHFVTCPNVLCMDPLIRWEAIDLVDGEIATGEVYVSESDKTWRLMFSKLPYEPPSVTRIPCRLRHPLYLLLRVLKGLYLPRENAAPQGFTAKPPTSTDTKGET